MDLAVKKGFLKFNKWSVFEPGRFTRYSNHPDFYKRIDLVNYLLLFLSVIVLFFLGKVYGTRYYFPCRDEALFLDIAKTFANTGILGAPSYAGNGMNMEFKTYFMPPVYPILLGFWFKIVPQTLLYARLLSNIYAALFILSIFSLARIIRRRSVIPGLIVLILVINPQFASMYNWARPDILALLFSYAALTFYFTNINSGNSKYQINLAIAMMLASLGMLTHPVGGLIGFGTIPVHMLITNFRWIKKPIFWFYVVLIPIFFVLLWGIYIHKDFASFKMQFIDWQLERKSSRIIGMYSFFKNVFFNFGYNLQNKINLIFSAFILIIFILKIVSVKSEVRSGLLVIFIILITGFAVESGNELPYPPLRLPAYYLLLLFCIEPIGKIARHLRTFKIRDGILIINHSLIIISFIIFLIFQSGIKTGQIIKEIHYSERAQAYNLNTMASLIRQATKTGSQIGIRISPDCFDLLELPGHFQSVLQLSWFDLSDEKLEKLVLKNDYLAITQSALDPGKPGELIDFSAPEWSNQVYDPIIKKHFTIDKIIELPHGGKTILYKKINNTSLNNE